MKLQAKSAKKDKLTTDQGPETNLSLPEAAPEITAAGTHEGSKPAKWSIGDPLPEFLPDEILAAVPEITSAPAPFNPQKRNDPIKNKLKVFNNRSKPPKRIKRGSTIIQVLEDDSGILPPKVSESSMSIRQAWLIGRRGTKGKEVIPRRKTGGGFVRK